MPNTTELLMKLRNGSQRQVNVTEPRCLLLVENGVLVTPDLGSGFLRGYDSKNLTQVIELPINISKPSILSQHAGAYYLGLWDDSILVINISNRNIINIISSPSLKGTRDMIFLNGGETMVVAASNARSLVFFKRVNGSTHNYFLSYNQSVSYQNPHGLLYVNDTFFYATSWKNNTICSYEKMSETWWNETLVIDARPQTNISNGAHVTIDECNRFWFALGQAGVLIYSENRTYEGRFSANGTTDVFDAIIAENYVVFISDTASNRIIRIDPSIQC